MSDFDRALAGAAAAILKRELTDGEISEFQRLAGEIGMGSVEDYLYMLMVFKRSEDRINCALASFEEGLGGKFDELSALERKINETLESSIERVLGEGASRIGADMGGAIASQAEGVLTSFGEYHSLRGQTLVVCFLWMSLSLAYWLGTGDILKSAPEGGVLETLLFLPAGWSVFFCGAFYSLLWACDHWGRIKETPLYKSLLGIQVFFLSALAVALL
jgi:hypothetical protein